MQNKSLMFKSMHGIVHATGGSCERPRSGGDYLRQVTDDMDVVIGATVKVVPGNTSTVTDVDGNFADRSLHLPSLWLFLM